MATDGSQRAIGLRFAVASVCTIRLTLIGMTRSIRESIITTINNRQYYVSHGGDSAVLRAPSLSINHEPLHKGVTTAIRNAILRGELTPGERLIEAELAERLGVSRAPLREALKQLIAEGLLINVPRRGTTVIELTDKDIKEIFSLRTALESLAVEIITPEMTAEKLAEFEELVGEMRAVAVSRDVSESVDVEIRFHELLCRMSGHSRLHAAWLHMGGQLRAFFAAADSQFDDLEFVERHQVLLDAIASGDTTRAVATLREHVANGANRVLTALQRGSLARRDLGGN